MSPSHRRALWRVGVSIALLLLALIPGVSITWREMLFLAAMIIFPWLKLFDIKLPEDDDRAVIATQKPQTASVQEPEPIFEPMKQTPARPVSAIPGARFAPQNPDGTVSVPTRIDEYSLAYHYPDVRIYTPPRLGVDFPSIDLGLFARFRFEPENEYDQNAIAAYVGDWKVGYLNKGKMRDMARDWLNRGDLVMAHVASVDDDEGQVTLFVAFYREDKNRKGRYDDDDDFDF